MLYIIIALSAEIIVMILIIRFFSLNNTHIR